MSIARPWVLWFLLTVVPVGLIQVREYFKGRADLLLLGGRWRKDEVRTLLLVKWFFASLAFQVFVIFGVLSLAGFSWGRESIEESRQGVDVMVAVDLSRSMLAEDVTPSRLQRAVATVRSLVGRLPSLRIGVVGFKGEATQLLPLTEDLVAVDSLLDGLTPGLITAPGTNVERGLAVAMDAYPDGTHAHRLILLISDGESLSGDPAAAIGRARREGYTVIALMTGTIDGAVIPLVSGDVVRDEDGAPVVTRADDTVLRSIAEQTDGRLLVADQIEPGSLVRVIEEYEQQRAARGLRLVDVDRFRLFLGIALLGLVVSVVIRVVPWHGLF